MSTRTWPRADRREAVPGGAIVPGICGRPHLRGGAYRWWRCPACHELAYRVCPDCADLHTLIDRIKETTT